MSALNLVQSALLFSGRDGKMLSPEEIPQLDWSIFDGIDLTRPSAEREGKVMLMLQMVNKLRNP